MIAESSVRNMIAWIARDKARDMTRDNGGRRSGIERRKALYTVHIPERRSGLDRRSGNDRRSGEDRRRSR